MDKSSNERCLIEGLVCVKRSQKLFSGSGFGDAVFACD